MTGIGVSWSAPAWVGLSDRDYSELIQRKAVAVTRRDKRRGGTYSVKEAKDGIQGWVPRKQSPLQPGPKQKQRHHLERCSRS